MRIERRDGVLMGMDAVEQAERGAPVNGDDDKTREMGPAATTTPAPRAVATAEPLSLPGMEGALTPVEEAQLRSAEARRLFEATGVADAWLDEYYDLIAEGWPWRVAVYMLWASMPQPRIPATQAELATQVLGLKSDTQIREWRQNNPAIDARVARLTLSALGRHRSEVIAALVESARTPSYRNHQDRKLYLEMTGDYVPHQAVSVGPLVSDDAIAEASTEELRALAGSPLPPAQQGAPLRDGEE